MQETNIGWCDFSLNLLRYRDPDGNIVHACVRISEGCRFCYACALAGRWGRKGKDFTAENMKPLTPFFDEEGAQKFLRSNKAAGKKVFINDMTDLFGEWVPDEIIDQHFAIFALRPDVTFQVLTKRAKRMRDYFLNRQRPRTAEHGAEAATFYHVAYRVREMVTTLDGRNPSGIYLTEKMWPLSNVHLGVSVEDQKNADARIPCLLETPAAVRWSSVEPMLGRVNLNPYLNTKFMDSGCYAHSVCLNGIVIGGESGAGHREMPIVDATILAQSAHAEGVAVFIKQDSGPRPGMQGRWPGDLWALKQWPGLSQ